MINELGTYLRHGYACINGTECLISYFQNKDFIEVMPLSKSEFLPSIPPYDTIEFSYSEDIYHKCFVRIKNASNNSYGGYNGEIDYLTKMHDTEEEISEIHIKSDEIDSLFNPLIFFYNEHKADRYDNPDLLYDSISAYHFTCIFREITLRVSVSYGNVFSVGIGSDLKTHAQLKVDFSTSVTAEEAYQLYCIICKAIRMLRCSNESNVIQVELCKKTKEKGVQRIGLLREKAYEKEKSIAYRQLDFSTIQQKIGSIFQQSIDDWLDGDNRVNRLFDSDSMSLSSWTDFTNIFISFENECKKHKGLERNDADIRVIREEICTVVKEIQPRNSEEKSFRDNIVNTISSQGKVYGQKTKLRIAYEITKQSLQSSINALLYEDCKSRAEEQRVKNAIDRIIEMRNTFLHGDTIKELTRYDRQCTVFLQVMTYSLMLKRAGLDDKEIELWIDQIFHCNNEYMKLQEESHKA